MTQRHKWADAIIAFAEGRAIQMRHVQATEWEDTDTLSFLCHEKYEYRVKPEKKTCWVNIYSDDVMGPYESKEDADGWANLTRLACIQITYEEGEGL